MKMINCSTSLRLQSVYQLPLPQLSSGSLHGRLAAGAGHLSAQDCIFLGKHAYNLGMLAQSVEWFLEGLRLARLEQKIKLLDQAEKLLAMAVEEHDEKVRLGETGTNLLAESIGSNLSEQMMAERIRNIRENLNRLVRRTFYIQSLI